VRKRMEAVRRTCRAWAWALFVATSCAGLLLLLVACNSDTTDGAGHVHIGCEAGAGCIEDTTVQGVCAGDRPHMCFCGADGGTQTPGPDCVGNAVTPYAPYTRALCCP
jgi:hypothetical protein